MKDELYITSPIPPSVNHYTAHRAIIKNGKPLGIVYKTKEAVTYQARLKEIVRDEVEKQNWVTNLENPRHFYVDAIFYMDKKHIDANNLWKCMLDAITETQLVWRDDDMVCERVNKIAYDAKNPRVELYIHYVDYVGVFDNEEAADSFIESNCVDCKRYKRNCTILRNALEGRVQPEINGNLCKKKNVKTNTTERVIGYDDLF